MCVHMVVRMVLLDSGGEPAIQIFRQTPHNANVNTNTAHFIIAQHESQSDFIASNSLENAPLHLKQSARSRYTWSSVANMETEDLESMMLSPSRMNGKWCDRSAHRWHELCPGGGGVGRERSGKTMASEESGKPPSKPKR